MKKVAFHTLGCKLNFSETSTISRILEGNEFLKVDFAEPADVYVINTCSVTQNANKECRNIVRKALRTSPHAFIAIIGCYAQLKPQEISEIPGVDLVLGASEKFNILGYLDNLEKNFRTEIFAGEIKHCNSFIPSFSANDRTRSFLKVQDGCDYFCSFCTIPLARGRSRSETISNTVFSARKAEAAGVKEIVLTGVNLGDFGKNQEGKEETFFDLIQQLDKLESVKRIRISSIEPNLLSDSIIEFVAHSNLFLPHFHIPLQSGSDTILKSMRRRYDSGLYAQRIEKIKWLMPDCCIGADVIVGFPGESEEEFLKTYEFLNQLDLSYLHVFTYSERENTSALRISDVVPPQARSRRSKMLHILSEKKKQHFYRQQINKIGLVLFESPDVDGFMRGFSENYIKVKIKSDPSLLNKIISVRFLSIDERGEMNCEISSELVNFQNRFQEIFFRNRIPRTGINRFHTLS